MNKSFLTIMREVGGVSRHGAKIRPWNIYEDGPAPASHRIKVICLECSAKFSTASLNPMCPKCHGYDVEPR
jgi:hypothetical protein